MIAKQMSQNNRHTNSYVYTMPSGVGIQVSNIGPEMFSFFILFISKMVVL